MKAAWIGSLTLMMVSALNSTSVVSAAGPITESQVTHQVSGQLAHASAQFHRSRYWGGRGWGFSYARPGLYFGYRYPAYRYSWSGYRPYGGYYGAGYYGSYGGAYYGGWARPAYYNPYVYRSSYYPSYRFSIGFGGYSPYYASYGYGSYGYYGGYRPYYYARPYYAYPTSYYRYGYYSYPSYYSFAYPYGYPGIAYGGIYGTYGF